MKDLDGNFPLHHAVKGAKKSIEVLELVLKNGGNIDVNQKNKKNETSLHFAAKFPTDQMNLTIPMLLENGADKTCTNSDKKTPEQIARELGHLFTAELLQ